MWPDPIPECQLWIWTLHHGCCILSFCHKHNLQHEHNPPPLGTIYIVLDGGGVRMCRSWHMIILSVYAWSTHRESIYN